MSTFDFVPYMQNVATTLKELQHSDTDKHFHKVGSLAAMDELLTSSNQVNGYQLVVVDKKSGRLDDTSRSDNLLDRNFNTFFVVKTAGHGNYADRHNVIDGCMLIVKKILSKMFYDKRNSSEGLRDLDRSSFYYDTIGPFGQNFHGIMVSFSMISSPGIQFNTDDWI